ncbi:hypothetical protein COOONC_06674 [Cooperia oncophora]
MVILGGVFFSQLRPSVTLPTNAEVAVVEERSTPVRRNSDEDSPLLESSAALSIGISRRAKRLMAVAVALVAGIFYGTTFVPVIYIQDHPEMFPDATKNGLAYVFAYYCGIFFTATFLLVLYIAFSGNNPIANSKIIGPSFLAGCMWAIAQSFWFVANDNLSQPIAFPIISMVPGVCAAMWSVFYFREITGHRNLRILFIAIGTTLVGAVLVGISK